MSYDLVPTSCTLSFGDFHQIVLWIGDLDIIFKNVKFNVNTIVFFSWIVINAVFGLLVISSHSFEAEESSNLCDLSSLFLCVCMCMWMGGFLLIHL